MARYHQFNRGALSIASITGAEDRDRRGETIAGISDEEQGDAGDDNGTREFGCSGS